jgi:hypothetical protein
MFHEDKNTQKLIKANNVVPTVVPKNINYIYLMGYRCFKVVKINK